MTPIQPLFLNVFAPITFPNPVTNSVSVRHVHWLGAQAQENHWDEECILLKYEMEWTVCDFMYKSQIWQLALSANLNHLGSPAYAQWQAAMWDQLVHRANQSFKNINKHYKSPL